jgi:hypothetical protein
LGYKKNWCNKLSYITYESLILTFVWSELMWSYVYISKDDQENDGTKCDEDISVEQESSTLNRAPKRDMNFDSSTHRKDYQNG